MISRKSIDDVMLAARIDEVVGDFVSLKRRGSNMIGLCPFHNEKTPSFNVSPSKGIFKCFGCGQAGDSVKFVMELEKLSYPEAIRYLARKYSIDLEETEQNSEQKQEQMDRESMHLLNEWVMKFFEEQMLSTDEGKTIALSYFRERGFSDQTIETFALGYHPPQAGILYNSAVKAGYNPEFLIKTGLVIEKDGQHFDRFRGRVMFPIRSAAGKVIGFGGRILENDKKIAKYLNSPESEIYHKSSVLYGLYESRKGISREDLAILVEGYTDVISLHQAGIDYVVASSGTSLTTDQIRLIKRYTSNITMIYDGDPAGMKATFRGLDMLLEQGMNVKIITLPDGDDPDSFAKSNTPAFLKSFLQEEASDFISYKTGVLRDEAAGDPIKTAGMIREVIQSVSLIPDLVLRSVYLKETAVRLDTDEQTLITEMNRLISERQKHHPQRSEETPLEPAREVTPKPEESTPLQSGSFAQEADLIRILILYANLPVSFLETDEQGNPEEHLYRAGDIIVHELESDELLPQDAIHLEIFNCFRTLPDDSQDFPGEQFFLHHDNRQMAEYVIHLTSTPYELSENWQNKHQIFVSTEADTSRKMVMTAIYAYKLRRVKALLEKMSKQLETFTEEEEMLKLLDEMKSLQHAKIELARQLQYVIV
ncbi:MAG: DNA primase [Bacteroidia bacterium]